jgi:hypothetical protein
MAFRNGAAFERQQVAGVIECALCGSRVTAKAPAAEHVVQPAVPSLQKFLFEF